MNVTDALPRVGPAVEKITLIAGRSPVIAVLSVGLVISMMTSGAQLLQLSWAENWPYFLVIAMAALTLFELARMLAMRAAPLPVLPFAAGALLIGLGLRIAYVWFTQPEWHNDFLRYWIYGLNLAGSDFPEVLNVYGQRAFFLTRPLIEIFGDHREIVPAANIVLLTAVQLFGYDVLRRTRSHQAAQAFVLLWLVAPEPLMTSAVPNHDLAGLLLLSLSLWLWVIGQERLARGRTLQAAAIWMVLGIALALLESIRGLGTLALLVFGLLTGAVTVIALSRRRPLRACRPMLLSLLVAVISFAFFNAFLAFSGAVMPAETKQESMLRYTTPHSTSLSDGTHKFMYGFSTSFTDDITDMDDFDAFRTSVVISDFVQDPLRRIRSSAARVQRQYALGSQINFYLKGVDTKATQIIFAFTNIFVILFSASLLFSIYLLLRHRVAIASLDHYLLLLVACSSIVLLVIGENQPRYLSMIWLAGAIVIASQFSLGSLTTTRAPSAAIMLASSTAFLLALACLAWLFLSATFTPAGGRILDDWTFQSDSSDARRTDAFLNDLQGRTTKVIFGRDGKSIPTDFGKLSLKLMLPDAPSNSSFALAEQKICGISDQDALEFQYDAPAKHLAGRRDAYELRVRMDGAPVWSAMLPNAGHPVRIRLPIQGTDKGCVAIAFQVVAHNRSHLASWQRASLVEIFFARIVQNR